MHRDAAQHSGRRHSAPAGFFSRQLQHAGVMRMDFQHRKAERDGVFAGLLCEHVDHVFRRMRSVRGADGSPPQNRHTCFLGMEIDLGVRDGVG